MDTGQPPAAFDDEIRVEYDQFGLSDEEAEESFSSLRPAQEGMRVGAGTVAFLSDANDHYAAVRFESWPHEPPTPPPPWDVEEGMEEVIELPSGPTRPTPGAPFAK
jgi:hypothetical protein